MMSNKVEIESDYRYPKVLRLHFNVPAGMGSYGYDSKSFEKEFPESTKTLSEYETITNVVNIIINSFIGQDIEIGWRDDQEVEIEIGDEEFSIVKKDELITVLKDCLELFFQ